MNWGVVKKPLEHAEGALIEAILGGRFPIGSKLPGERALAQDLGVTRPTLREALRRMERDGWVTVRHGKATVVNDIWRDGRMNIIQSLVEHGKNLPAGFVVSLLEVRRDLAPRYTRGAFRRDPEGLARYFASAAQLEDTPQAFAAFDWQMHKVLTLASGNPIYPLFLNGFAGFYEKMACVYFASSGARARSRRYYQEMQEAISGGEEGDVYALTLAMMEESIALWKRQRQDGHEQQEEQQQGAEHVV